MTRRALITGITGQDGSYLAELLLAKGYHVVGMVRRSSTLNFERIGHLQDDLELVPGDLLDEVSMIQILRSHQPDEVYNLAAQSFVQTSFGQPVLTGETTALGVTRLLDAYRADWTIDVSSPGPERPLRRPEHFRRAIGGTVKLKTASSKRLRGTLLAVDDDAVTVAVNGSTLEIPVDEIVRGNLIDEGRES